MNIQYSRGCPFNCEFCNITSLYGNIPRTKDSAQLLREMDAIYESGWKGEVFFVDDNFIGNKKKLMDDIPNKIRNAIGIMVEVNLYEETGKYFIEIVTRPYSVPISLRGRYYYRSGSTKQELTGASLNEFLLKKSGL